MTHTSTSPCQLITLCNYTCCTQAIHSKYIHVVVNILEHHESGTMARGTCKFLPYILKTKTIAKMGIARHLSGLQTHAVQQIERTMLMP